LRRYIDPDRLYIGRGAVFSPFGGTAAAETADFDHVAAVGGNLLAALAAGKAGFFRREFVCRSLAMGRHAALAGDFTLFPSIH